MSHEKSLGQLLDESKAIVDKMSTAELEEMVRKQGESWVRGEMAMNEGTTRMKPAPIKVVFEVPVTSVEEQFKSVYRYGTGNEAVFEQVSIGWFVLFEGSWEKIFFGMEKPKLKPGEMMRITFEKVS